MRVFLKWTGIVLFAILGIFLLLFGGLYSSVHNLLWFHAAAVPKESLEAVRPLYFALMKLIGGASIGLGLLGLYVDFGPVRRGMALAATTLAITYAIPIAMAGLVAETLRKTTGAPTSWNIMLVLLAIDALALIAALAGRSRG